MTVPARLGNVFPRRPVPRLLGTLALTSTVALGVVALPVLGAPAYAAPVTITTLAGLQYALGVGCTDGSVVQLDADIVAPTATVEASCTDLTLTLAAADVLTLQNVLVDPGAALSVNGDSTDVVTVDATADDTAAGIQNTGATLVLTDLRVVATGGRLAAGIGGGFQGKAGTTVIDGTAQVEVQGAASAQGAAIGGGYLADGGLTIIQDDAQVSVTTRTSAGGAALGGGYAGDGGTLFVRDRAFVSATARSGANGAAIGGGFQGDGGDVQIGDDAVVVATARSGAKGAAIGGGYQGDGGTVEIRDQAQVVATSSVSGDIVGAAIGGGPGGDGADVSIEGSSVVTATASDDGSPIGAGSAVAGEERTFGTLTVESTLRLPSGVLDVADTPGLSEMVVTPGGQITGSDTPMPGAVQTFATITGTGQIVNNGSIVFPASAVRHANLYGNDYRIVFDTRGSTRAPASRAPRPTRVFAASFDDGGRAFPADPTRPGFRFVGWNTKPGGRGDAVSASSMLPGTSIDGVPQLVTAFAVWARR